MISPIMVPPILLLSLYAFKGHHPEGLGDLPAAPQTVRAETGL